MSLRTYTIMKQSQMSLLHQITIIIIQLSYDIYMANEVYKDDTIKCPGFKFNY